MSFGVQATGRRALPHALPRWVLAAACIGGCSPQSAPGRVEDSQTSGRIQVVCAPEARDLVERERATFQALYPQATLEMRQGTSREAVAALFAAQCDLAAITRELLPEERAAAVRGGLELEGYPIARDAVVAVVNRRNPVENVAVQDLRGIYRGEIKRWSVLGGEDRPVRVVIQPPEADITAFFEEEVMGGEAIQAPSFYESSDSTVVARVALDPDAIGYVTLAGVRDDCRSLRVASLPGLPYWKPDLEAVYKGDYPLTRFINTYVRPRGPKLALGFITFLTSRDGQEIVHEAGLVPTTVPVRFTRRSPMQSSHGKDAPPQTP
ncbi:MAG TPA: PstS family phosphate ABC transporter substrate-binding protein [Candidatus Eisenbacteria bacterium]